MTKMVASYLVVSLCCIVLTEEIFAEDDDDKRTEDLLCSNSSTVHTAAPELVKSPVGSPNTTVGIVAPGSRSPMGTPLVVPAPRSPMDNTRSPPRSPPSATVARVDDPRPMAEVERKVADLKVADLKVADLNLSPSAQPDINGPQANGAVTGLVTAFPHRTPTTPSVHMRHATMPDSTRPQYLAMPGAVHQMHSHNQMHSNNFSAPRPAIQTHNGIAMSPQLKGKDVSAPSVEHVQC